MAIIINFHEYVKRKAQKEISAKENDISRDISTKSGRIIYFNREVIE